MNPQDPSQAPGGIAAGTTASGGAASPARGGRPHRRRGSSAVPFLLLFAVFFFILAFSSSARNMCDEMFGLERLELAAFAFVCLHMAWISFDTTRMRERLLDLLAETMRALRGPDMARDAEAIDILVKAIASANLDVRKSAREHLVRLTGRDLGEDPARWTAWWAESRPKSVSAAPGGKS